jgi:hypothetical protein
MFTRAWIGRMASWLLSGALAATAVLGSFTPLAAVPVYAGPSVEDPPPPADGAGLRVAAIKLAYQRLQSLEARTQKAIDKARTGANRIENLIAQAKERGRDTAALEAALASFRSSMDSAQAKHDQGEAILEAHAGFDDQGEVTDFKAAWDTVKSAGQEFREVGKTIASALRELHLAIRDWREMNREAATEEPDWPR